ncbi:hypothetical protein FOZ63_003636 [Perkinsus olseni]|uniref:Uncharacterized protein n=1 Tax=Perkinsus olseni TaxID=32597 RepID=A0A7J6TUI9_PEROL|nr:hypothetical protein FOZ63_003636 [Perkinsus olseni]
MLDLVVCSASRRLACSAVYFRAAMRMRGVVDIFRCSASRFARYKFSTDLTFILREAELRREGPLRSRATEWLRGKVGAGEASFAEAFADNELTGGYTVDIVIGDPSNKHGVLVAPRNACYRSHLDGRRDRAPMATQLNVAALKNLGWKVGIIYEALLEPAKSTQNISDDTGMTSELRKAGVLPTEE